MTGVYQAAQQAGKASLPPFVCPACHSTLDWFDQDARCPDCGRTYESTDGIPVLVTELGEHKQQQARFFDDVDSEIVRHAEPLEETLQRQAATPEAMETVSSGVDIQYNADDLEIPAFLRKRSEG